jgi:hypothetical protein
MKKLSTALTPFKEWGMLLIAILLFWISPTILRFVDPTAAAFDAGILQIPILKILVFIILQQFVWLNIKVLWPTVHQYFITFFNNDFLHLQKWERLAIALSVYFVLLALLVFVSLT